MTAPSDDLVLQGVGFRYRNAPAAAVAGVDLAVRAGKFAALIGPNGAGKSTLLRLATGALAADAGTVRVAGLDVATLSVRERARRIALVPQEPLPPFRFRAIDLALLGRTPYRGGFSFDGPDDIRKATEALARAGASELAERPLSELSGGERQRVAVARALAQDAPVLLLDEPTTFLDLQHRLSLFAVLRRLAQDESLAILTVSHDIALAAQFCDPIVVLHAGRVHAQGSPVEVVTEELLREVFGVRAVVQPHPETGAPVPLPWEAGAG